MNAYLLASESRYAEAIEVMEDVLQSNRKPGWEFFLASLYVDVGRAQEAIAIVERLQPEFLSDNEIDLHPNDTANVVTAAHALCLAGETARANYLYDLVLESREITDRALGWASRLADVQIHAMRGDRDKAVTALPPLQRARQLSWSSGELFDADPTLLKRKSCGAEHRRVLNQDQKLA